jgi:membrane-bound lytic murein transglycosylase D
MMEDLFKDKNLPIELTRIVFVESSFNVNAQSKVGASGLWQIMPIIGKKFKYLKPSFDKRNHPEYATKCAIEILRQNYQILKSWPLAVTSYNFGVGSMLKVKRKMKASDADDIFGSKDLKKHIGFASRNFYATFLAALHVESKANLYFGEPLMIGKPIQTENIYLSQKMKISELIEMNKVPFAFFKDHNPHIFKKYFKANGTKEFLPKGTLVSLPYFSNSAKTATNQEDD